MKCNQCGRKIHRNDRHCPYCGAMNYSENKKNKGFNDSDGIWETGIPPKKKKKWPIVAAILGAICVLLVLLIGGGFVFYFKSPAKQIISCLEEGKYDRALFLYTRKVEDSTFQSKLLNKLLEDYIESINKDDLEESTNRKKLLEPLRTIEEMDIDDVSDTAREYADAIELALNEEEILNNAAIAAKEGDYETALQLCAQIPKTSERYQKASSSFEKYRQELKDKILSDTDSPNTTEDYEAAILLVQNALTILESDADLNSRLQKLEQDYMAMAKSNAITTSSQEAESGDYASAVRTLREAVKNNPDDADLSEKLAQAILYYENDIKKQAENYVNDEKYDKAIEIINAALKVAPESETLVSLKKEIENKKPVRLADLAITESNGYKQIVDGDVQRDTIGNAYDFGNLFCIGGYNSYSKYYLGGRYKTMTFTIAVDADIYGDPSEITILADGERILYTSGETGRDFVPVKKTIDVSDVQWLTIKRAGSQYNIAFLIVNPILYVN